MHLYCGVSALVSTVLLSFCSKKLKEITHQLRHGFLTHPVQCALTAGVPLMNIACSWRDGQTDTGSLSISVLRASEAAHSDGGITRKTFCQRLKSKCETYSGCNA